MGLRVSEAEALLPETRVFVLRVRHNGSIEEATADTVLQAGDTLAVAGSRDVLVKMLGAHADEVEDKELLALPVEGVDVLVSNPPPADTILPLVNLEPVTATRKAKTTLVATASDNIGVVKVEFYVNGTLQCTDTTAPYTCVWTVGNAIKTYLLQAKAYDAAGNVGVSPTVTVVPK